MARPAYSNLTWVPQYDNPPVKPKLESIAESVSHASVSSSLTEFEDVGLLLGPDKMIIPPANTSEPSDPLPQWSPRVDPHMSHKNSIQSYLSNVICLADSKNARKRVKFDEISTSPYKRARLASRLEDIIYKEDGQEDYNSDGDLVRLQMVALNGLKEDVTELTALVKQMEEEKMRLTDTFRQQTERRMRILNDFVMRRGSDLKKHGEFLVQMAEQEYSAYGCPDI